MDVMGPTVLTRASIARLQSYEDHGDALREVMEQLDAEDEEGEPSDDDSDYAEGGNTARDTGSDTGLEVTPDQKPDPISTTPDYTEVVMVVAIPDPPVATPDPAQK
ncbi:hypothetical protein L916_08531, partial [Phytophthora nicotianae]